MRNELKDNSVDCEKNTTSIDGQANQRVGILLNLLQIRMNCERCEINMRDSGDEQKRSDDKRIHLILLQSNPN